MNVLTRTIIFLFWLCVCLVVLITNTIHTRMEQYRLEKRDTYMDKIYDQVVEHFDEDVMLKKFQKTYNMKDRIVDMSKVMKHINEKQRIHNSYKFSQRNESFDNTVLVIKVHNNIRYLAVLINSIRRMKLITKSFVIFAHDFYNADINSLVRRLSFARIMQIFYPYGTQMFPNMYPGEDGTFCWEMNMCVTSRKRNATLAQNKLSWWWVTHHVFDHIEVLKNYNGYIYFLDTELYPTSDFIHVAKMLERLQPVFCPNCDILSLAARPPRPELYLSEDNRLVVDVWGRSNYSNSVIGFNRKTWNKIKLLKQEFCDYKESSWESSLRHLASKTQSKHFLMLASEGPRAFPTTGCGAFRNGTNCTLDSNFQDILDFVYKIRKGLYPKSFKLKVDNSADNLSPLMAARGDWEDARDREFCLYFAHRGSKVYF